MLEARAHIGAERLDLLLHHDDLLGIIGRGREDGLFPDAEHEEEDQAYEYDTGDENFCHNESSGYPAKSGFTSY